MMSIKCQAIDIPRSVLCALTLGIICFCLAGRTSGGPITEGRALSNGLIAFADAPDRKPSPQASQHAQIYTITPDGGNRKQLTTGEPGNFFSAWSPDGKEILLDTQRRKRPEIWIMNSDGSDEHVLVSDVKVIPMRTSWQPVFSIESSNKPDAGDGK